jgi:hypothetical protein
MNYSKLICTLLLCLFGYGVSAESYMDGVLTVQIPSGFEGPVKQSPAPNASVVAYTKRSADSKAATLLQITTYDFGSQLEGMPEDQRVEITEGYLMQFLSGVERRRTSFVKSPASQLTLGSIPASRIDWTGIAEGIAVSGTMYCVIVGTRVISFHTQTSEDASSQAISEAKRSIESVSFGTKE